MKYHGEISYTIDKEHPDIKYIKDWTEDKVFTFSDTYIFSNDYEEEDEENIIAYIKRDLKLVAGGGYNTDHIHNVTFKIDKIK